MARWKFEIGEAVVTNRQAPGDYIGRTGVIVTRGPGRAEYGVRFDGQTTTEYLNSWWLDASRRLTVVVRDGVRV